jgi:hypothetical protein
MYVVMCPVCPKWSAIEFISTIARVDWRESLNQ